METHSITGPSTAIEPSTASTARTGRVVLKLRWVNSRWKPTVMPSPVSAYVIASTTRSCQCSVPPHASQPAATSAASGTPKTTVRTTRSAVSFSIGTVSATTLISAPDACASRR